MFGKRNRSGFTLVELLLVIVIMGVLASVVVQQFEVSEAAAKDTVGGFNEAAVEKVIHDYQSVHGVYPSGFHTGLDDAAATASIAGVSKEAALNMASSGTPGEDVSANVVNNYTEGCQVTTLGANVKALTAGQQQALREYGIHRFAVGGYTAAGEKGTQTPLDTAGLVCWVLTDDGSFTGMDLYRGGELTYDPVTYLPIATLGDEVVTINGRALSTYNAWGESAVVLVYVTGDVDWTAVYKGDPDETGWGTMTAKSKMTLAKPATDPKAVTETIFPYYLAAFYLSPDQVGSALGYSCKQIENIDADLNAVKP
jgi:prepilin-type N-terminal cleavage/methylation domain-containing protein